MSAISMGEDGIETEWKKENQSFDAANPSKVHDHKR